MQRGLPVVNTRLVDDAALRNCNAGCVRQAGRREVVVHQVVPAKG